MKKRFGVSFVLAALLLVLPGLLVVAGCSDDDDVPSELLATWQLQEFRLDDGTVTAVDDPAKYTVRFESDNTTNITADCNSCSGSFTVDGDDLTFGNLACTLAACAAGSFDTQFQAALSTTSSYEITDGQLFLNYDGGELRLTPAPELF